MRKFILFIVICVLLSGCGINCDPLEIHIGMSEKELINKCGKPSRINFDAYLDEPLKKQLVYTNWNGWPVIFLYIQNDKLIIIQWEG